MGLVALLGSACQTPTLPTTAQAGATVLIPMDYETAKVGYGGSEVADLQRGELVWTIEQPAPNEGAIALTTRFTVLGTHDARSINAVDGNVGHKAQLVSVVDIPASTPPGVHDLYVRRLYQGEYSLVYPSLGSGPLMQLRVLPNQIDLGGGQVVTGSPTPLEGWEWWGTPSGWSSLSSVLPAAIPRPVLEIGFSRPVSSAAITVTFPTGSVHAVGAVLPIGLANGTAWLEEISADSVRVHAAAGDFQFESLGVVFVPSGAEPLDPNDAGLQLSDVELGDRLGRLLEGASATVLRIR